MNRFSLVVLGAALALSLQGCSAGADGPSAGTEKAASAVSLQLATTGSNGNRYRLGPAQFQLDNPYPYWNQEPISMVVDAEGDTDILSVPVDPGDWTVTLKSGWKLQRVDEGGALTPVAATLTSQNSVRVGVSAFRVSSVNFAFHLGESGIDLGVTVDEGVPTGYDGIIRRVPNDPPGIIRYQVEWSSGGGACCFDSVDEAKAAYPYWNVLIVE